jgi:hypothetical protein
VAQITKTFVVHFFRKGERILGESSPNPKQLLAYIPKKLSQWKKRKWICSQREPIKDFFASVVCSRSRLSCKKRSDANIHKQSSSREILESKHTVQRVSKEQERDGNYGQEDKRHDSKQSIDRNGQEVTKME